MSAPRITPYPDQDGNPGVQVITPASERFRELLLALVPSEGRAWCESPPFWWIASDWAEDVADLVVEHFGYVQVLNEAEEVTERRFHSGRVV